MTHQVTGYLGMSLLFTGLAIAVRGSWVLILVLPLVLILRYGVVAREESYLERRFATACRLSQAGPVGQP